MFVKKSIYKAKNVICRRLKNLQSLISKGYDQNQNQIPGNNNTKTQQVDKFKRDMSEESCIRCNEVVKAKESNRVTRSTSKDLNVRDRLFTSNEEKSVGITTKEERVKEDNNIEKERGCLIAEKMKEVETLDIYSKDHVTDIEEALHYYSLITCPVYKDIVDRFFMDMYSEFLLAEPSASIHNSTRRLHSMRL
ncbi:hypothetical protein AgCh_020944 [Apium graveolens]